MTMGSKTYKLLFSCAVARLTSFLIRSCERILHMHWRSARSPSSRNCPPHWNAFSTAYRTLLSLPRIASLNQSQRRLSPSQGRWHLGQFRRTS